MNGTVTFTEMSRAQRRPESVHKYVAAIPLLAANAAARWGDNAAVALLHARKIEGSLAA